MSKQTILIGIDLGGTSIKMGLVSTEGELLSHQEISTRTKEGVNAIIEDMVQYAKTLVQDQGFALDQVQGIGIGIPGLLDMEQGIVRLAPNLGWKDVAIKKQLEEKLNIPVKIENDANIAALGEAWVGAGKGYKHIVMATIGTGIGGGIIIDGKILHGKKGMAAELGHIPISDEGIQCGCGNYGCLETVSSATGMIRKAKEVVTQGRPSLLTEQYVDKMDEITAKSVIDAAKLGDHEAMQIVNRAGSLLGKALATVANLLDPEIMIIGGGVSRAGDILFNPIKQAFHEHGLKNIIDSIEIVPAQLGNDAGMIGAASLFRFL
ncbi:ROK family glucokinase [Tepidibacillus sp. HK-1]|uniref:ROK family glucokinase n=1 Tax=Tepidibacillus sp. HK-1 TaxID=1883407 RepID=UPI0008535E00|nr:ROK family glucokinase [Tepidibacillus sp. HK-1]GBF10634.1 glucokinase [Tepidibacillus sp. HK-1]